MSITRKRQKNNIIAGSFVVVTIVAFFFVITVISDLSGFGRHQEIAVWFPVDLGTPGLEAGSDVTIAGVRVGRVEEVNLVTSSDVHQGFHVHVVLSLPAKYEVCKNTKAGLVLPIIGSGSLINLEGLGSGELLQPGDVIAGDVAPSILLRSAGIGQEEIAEIQAIIENIETVTTDMSRFTTLFDNEVTANGEEMAQELLDSWDKIVSIIDEAKSSWEEWQPKISSMMASAESGAAKADQLMADGQGMVKNIDDGVTNARATIDAVSPDVQEMIAHANAVTKKAEEEWSSKISTVLSEVETTVNHAKTALGDLDDAMTTAMPEIRHMMANMRLASDNLKLAMIEIRAEPWRLLASPDEEAMQQSLLFDAVRTYANAISDLNGSVGSLQSLHDRYGDEFDPASETVKQILDEMALHEARHADAEKLLYEFILQQTDGQ